MEDNLKEMVQAIYDVIYESEYCKRSVCFKCKFEDVCDYIIEFKHSLEPDHEN